MKTSNWAGTFLVVIVGFGVISQPAASQSQSATDPTVDRLAKQWLLMGYARSPDDRRLPNDLILRALANQAVSPEQTLAWYLVGRSGEANKMARTSDVYDGFDKATVSKSIDFGLAVRGAATTTTVQRTELLLNFRALELKWAAGEVPRGQFGAFAEELLKYEVLWNNLLSADLAAQFVQIEGSIVQSLSNDQLRRLGLLETALLKDLSGTEPNVVASAGRELSARPGQGVAVSRDRVRSLLRQALQSSPSSNQALRTAATQMRSGTPSLDAERKAAAQRLQASSK